MDQRIGFCTADDGVRLAYAVSGAGPPLVKAANWLSHLEFDWESPLWRHWNRALSAASTLVRYDARGCGLSDWDATDLSYDSWLDDLACVVDHLSLDEFDLLGISRGAPVAAGYAARYPDRVRRLVLYGGFVRGWKRRGDTTEQEERRAAITLARIGWGKDNPAYRQIFTTQFVPDGNEQQIKWFNEMQRRSTSAEMAVRLMESSGDIDVTDILPNVKTPTLVAHARGDARCSFEQGRELAALIRGSRFLPLEGRNHILLNHEPGFQQFINEMHDFLGREVSAIAPDSDRPDTTSSRELTTILFTDIVDSTRHAVRLGDREWTRRLHEHYELVRDKLKEWGGVEVDTAGDGFLATFGSPVKAIRCGLEIIRGSRDRHGIEVRAGVHTGECERVGDKLSGVALHAASRIMSLAGPSELFVSRTVKDLTSGSSIGFGAAGTHDLKGLPGEWELYSVPESAWRT